MIRELTTKIIDTSVAALTGAGTGVLLFAELKNSSPEVKIQLAQKFLPQVAEFLSRRMSRPAGARILGCKDCKEYGHGFMLHDEVWNAVITDEERRSHPPAVPDDPSNPLLICLKCCEKRLGHPIGPGDLIDVPINRPLFYVFNHTLTIRRADRFVNDGGAQSDFPGANSDPDTEH